MQLFAKDNFNEYIWLKNVGFKPFIIIKNNKGIIIWNCNACSVTFVKLLMIINL